MKFCPTILVAVILFIAALLTDCEPGFGIPDGPRGPRPLIPHNLRRRQADNVNLDGEIWANEFAPKDDDGNPQF
jgi:hypothetical protein